jgi:type II secretory pathway component HofQ
MNKISKSASLFPGVFSVVVCLSLLLLAGPGPAWAQEGGPLVDRLKGHPSSMKIQEVPVTTMLQVIGRQAGINIYVDDKITDQISIDLENLSLYEVFQLIMSVKKLHYSEKNQVIFVEREADFQASIENLAEKRFCTKYGNIGVYLDKLRKSLGPKGSVTETNRGNCLIIRDQQDNLEVIGRLLNDLDQPVPQVHIEARIVSLTQEAKRRLGIKWGYDNLSTRNPVSSVVDLSVTHNSNLTIGFLRNNLNLSVDLQAMQQDDQLHILSAPQILVLDGSVAEIKQGKEVPYVAQTSNVINTSFREANLSLKVTPRVMNNDFINLDVVVTNDSVDQSSSGSEPLINRQSITTNLFLANEATVVIGGILLTSDDNQNGSVPGISRIPLLGNLFKNSVKNRENSELVVFITPRIVRMPADAVALTTGLGMETAAPGSSPAPPQEINTGIGKENPGGG